MKKPKLAIWPVPSGLIKGFVLSAMKQRTGRQAAQAASSLVAPAMALHSDSEPIGVKTGGFKDSNDSGVKIVERKYPKYAEIKPEGRKPEGFQVLPKYSF